MMCRPRNCISPSPFSFGSWILISPTNGFPTVPILLFPVKPIVAPAVVSVIPYPSKRGMSNLWKRCRMSGLIGAAPVMAYFRFEKPIFCFAFFLTIPFRIGRLSHLTLLPRPATRLE